MEASIYQAELKKLYMFLSLLEAMPLSEMERAASSASTLGPMLHPTLWIQKGEAMEQDRTVISAFADAQRKIATLKRDSRPVWP